MIPAIITQIASGKKKLKLGSVSPTRDFSFVKDTVRGIIAMAESDKGVGQVVNLGSNFEISIRETVDLIAEIMGGKVEIETDPQRVRPEKSEVERLWADNRKAREVLGWEPEYAGREGFRRGLAETVAWFTDARNLEGFKCDIYNL